MKFCSLSSGSKRNCFYIESEQTAILIDNGISFAMLTRFMESIGRDVNNLEAIFITHEHTDHTRGLKTADKKLGIPVFIHRDSQRRSGIDFNDARELKNRVVVTWKDLQVFPFEVSHDAENTFGFKIYDGVGTLCLMSDIGSYDDSIVKICSGANLIALEANYDQEMLRNSSYPIDLKKRISGRWGHLSNDGCAEMLHRIVGGDTRNIVFLHLSENNNTPGHVKRMIESELESKYRHVEFHVASREEPGILIEV